VNFALHRNRIGPDEDATSGNRRRLQQNCVSLFVPPIKWNLYIIGSFGCNLGGLDNWPCHRAHLVLIAGVVACHGVKQRRFLGSLLAQCTSR
jgi:hypothetical protein